MKYSYHWLQEHLDKPLPQLDELVRTVTIKSFEVEGVEEYAATGDTILEMKVLPDRAHDALSHRGMAREVAALFGLPRKERVLSETKTDSSVSKVEVAVLAATLCPRYIGVRVDGIVVAPAPDDIAAKLTAIGGRSINNIVDLTNFVLFDIGQPMHAFDAAKVAGGITVRSAVAGESMTTLDGKALSFDGTELVIADDEGVLALAGVKGGKKAEVDNSTTSIIFESANFDPTLTRRTSTKHGIKTDASKRYENGMTSEFALEGMQLALSELVKIMPSARISTMTDVYPNPEKSEYKITITITEINSLLGSQMSRTALDEVLERLGFHYVANAEEYVVSIPNERLDLRIKQDLIEEIGRNYGYDKIDPALPKLSRKGVPHKRLHYANKVRNFLVEQGYSEVFTYSFAPKGEGEVEVLNPVGKDRPFMRSSLFPGIGRALASNFYNSSLLELEDIKIFEIGNVFTPEGERMRLAIGAMGGTKKRWKALEGEFQKTAQEIKDEVFGCDQNDRPGPTLALKGRTSKKLAVLTDRVVLLN
jgi:phenylalanyl-tRNA synthetase beta chain